MRSKRYLCAMAVSVAIMLSGCGGSNNVQSSAEQGGLQPSQSEEQSATAEPVRTVKAADVFDDVTGVSKEWQDGLYVINGKDSDGAMICGVMDKDQNVRIYEDYTALYPLADGHLIATQDTDVSGECYFEGIRVPIDQAGIHGVIIDAEGNIVYEPENDGSPRMYVVNSHLILQLNAKMDFDGITASANVINQNGEVLRKEVIIPDSLVEGEFVKFEDGGEEWNLLQYTGVRNSIADPNCFIQRGFSDEYGENLLLKLYWDSSTKNMVPHNWFAHFIVGKNTTGMSGSSLGLDKVSFFDSQSFIEHTYVPYLKTSDDSEQQEQLKKHNFDAVGEIIQNQRQAYSGDTTYMGLLGEESTKKAHFLVTWYGENERHEVIDEEGKKIEVPEKYLEAMTGYRIIDNRMIFFMENDANMNFCTILNADGSVCEEPFAVEGDVSELRLVDLKDDLLVYASDVYSSDRHIVIADINTGDKVADIVLEDPECTITDIWFMDDYLMVRYEDGTETGNYLYQVYDLKGKQIL